MVGQFSFTKTRLVPLENHWENPCFWGLSGGRSTNSHFQGLSVHEISRNLSNQTLKFLLLTIFRMILREAYNQTCLRNHWWSWKGFEVWCPLMNFWKKKTLHYGKLSILFTFAPIDYFVYIVHPRQILWSTKLHHLGSWLSWDIGIAQRFRILTSTFTAFAGDFFSFVYMLFPLACARVRYSVSIRSTLRVIATLSTTKNKK